jgi:hypothetical protein
VYVGNVLLSVVLVAFCIFHFYLIGNGLTTIEFREKMSVKFDESPYSLSCIENFFAVFGRNPLFWFVPVRNFYLERDAGDSLTFQYGEKV